MKMRKSYSFGVKNNQIISGTKKQGVRKEPTFEIDKICFDCPYNDCIGERCKLVKRW